MRHRLLAFLSLAALAAALVPLSGGLLPADSTAAAAASAAQKPAKANRGDAEEEYTERDEFRQSYALASGAEVRVSGINGSVDVETHSGSTAEVHVVRSARRRSDLDYHKVIVEQTGSGLVVRGEKHDKRDWEEDRNVRQRVSLRLPRSIDFTASGVNGRTSVGEVDGPVKLSGINGRVEVGRARGYTELSGINGAVVATISQLGERGIRISGINGRVELSFVGAINADLSVSGVNGSIDADMQNLVLDGEVKRGRLNARIGSGGTPITVSGVNGSVKLVPRS